MTSYNCRNCGKSCGRWLYCSSECQRESEAKNAQLRAQSVTFGADKSRYSPETLRSYGHTALPGAVNSRNIRRRVCSQCGKLHERYSQYCSNACKQKAYRKRHNPKSGSWENRKARAQNAVRTKQWVIKTIVCEHCGEERSFTVAQCTNRIYCSDKCKQAAYRQRKQAND